jgi:protein-tyrosine phosphatase
MPEVLDWRRLDNPAQAARLVALFLRRGGVVALPTETAYVAAGDALQDEPAERVRQLAGERPVELAIAGLASARDWLPGLGAAGRRLAQRLWPGPLTLASSEGGEDGLAGRLTGSLREMLYSGGLLHLRCPAHEVWREMLGWLSGPVVFTTLASRDGEAVSARQVLEWAGDALDAIVDDGPCRYRQPATAVEVRGSDWNIRRAGLLNEELIRQQLACLIVFVCTGNTCRSPLAEALCKKRLAERLGCSVAELPARGYRVLSAGLAAPAGLPAADQAVEVAAAMGADLTQHASRPLTPELAGSADHLLVMTGGHLRALVDHFPAGPARPRLLNPAGQDVADPVGQPREVYEACAGQLLGYIDRLVEEWLPAPS